MCLVIKQYINVVWGCFKLMSTKSKKEEKEEKEETEEVYTIYFYFILTVWFSKIFQGRVLL